MRHELLRAAARLRAATSSDPYYNSVVSLLSFDGNLTDAKGRTWTAVGTATTSAVKKKFGTHSLVLNGSGDYLNGDGNSSLALGAGDWTIEMFVQFGSPSSTGIILDYRPNSTQGNYVTLYADSGVLKLFMNSADRITGTTSLGTDGDGPFKHVALCKASGNIRLFLEGTQEGSTYADAVTHTVSAGKPRIGSSGFSPSLYHTGYIDEMRITKGVARYTANFTPPSAAFPRG